MSDSRVQSTHDELTVAICGNPNCGKTTLFNALTGLRQKVGNYPGVTVEKTTGVIELAGAGHRRIRLIDTPGSYSLSAFSPDEYIATRVLSGNIAGEPQPDVILCVMDATNLERSLYLLFQVLKVGRPVVVALNMIDLAKRHGIRLKFERLAKALPDIPFVPVVASKGDGVDKLRTMLSRITADSPRTSLEPYDPLALQMVEELAEASDNGHRSTAEYLRLLFDQGGPAEEAFLAEGKDNTRELLDSCRDRIRESYGSLSAGETYPLSQVATRICSDVVEQDSGPVMSKSEKIDRLLLHSFFGPVILVGIMLFMFQSVFSWAEPAMGFIDSTFGALGGLVEGAMSPGPLRSLVVDGIIGGVGSVLVFLPQIIILFLFIAVLEDSGYMPRAAFLVDRLFGWCGLSGKSFVPMLSSFACAVPGIMATRTIENRKLRILTIMVAPLMSCSARLPVYTIMIAAFIPQVTILGFFNSRGLVLTLLYLMGLLAAVLISFVLNRLLYRQERATFMMDMPSYTVPTFRSIFIRIYTRVKSFVGRAGTVILAITVVIWALSYYPRSEDIAAVYNDRIAAVETAYQTALADLEGAENFAAGSDEVARLELTRNEALQTVEHERAGAYLRDSYFGRVGRFVAPAFKPLGWDWKITMATLASFPAREVIIATLGTIYNLGEEEGEDSSSLIEKMQRAEWEEHSRIGERVFTPAVALSVMVFFALCAQCGATLVTIGHETAAWKYAVAAFVYMTSLAYIASFAVYQVFKGVSF